MNFDSVKSLLEWGKLKANSNFKFSFGFFYKGPAVKKVQMFGSKNNESNLDLFEHE
jgi:hypothetical protein